MVDTYNELKDGHPRLAVRSEATPIDQLAFEGGEETLAHRIVVDVADRACRWTNAGLPYSERRKRPTCIANRDPNDGRRCRAFGPRAPCRERRAPRGSSGRPRRPIRRSGATRRRARPRGKESRPTSAGR